MTHPYSVSTLAARWGCSKRHITKLVKQGRLQPFRVGNLLRFRPEVVEADAAGSNPLSPTNHFNDLGYRRGSALRCLCAS